MGIAKESIKINHSKGTATCMFHMIANTSNIRYQVLVIQRGGNCQHGHQPTVNIYQTMPVSLYQIRKFNNLSTKTKSLLKQCGQGWCTEGQAVSSLKKNLKWTFMLCYI
jgi:hypothetical protein